MSRKTRPVRSREYKVMLRAGKFAGGTGPLLAAAEQFRNALASDLQQAADSHSQLRSLASLAGDFEPGAEKKQAAVQFFDTKDRRLRSADVIFRQRQPQAGGPIELTLKCRHPDRFLVSSVQTGGKTKFEEDLKTTRACPFISLHSMSGKRKVDDDISFEELSDIRSRFKHLKKLLGDAYDGDLSVLRVCNFVALQTVLEGVQLQICDELSADCALILWRERDAIGQTPCVAEFSFRVKDKKIGAKREPFTGKIARQCLAVLQTLRCEHGAVAPWVHLDGPTKTAYAYTRTRA